MTTSRGFTLIELVVALVLSALVVGFIATLMTSPVDAYVDQSERAIASASAERLSTALREDLSKALPFSVRIRNSGGRSIVEMLEVEEVSFYLPQVAGSPEPKPERELDPVGGDTFVLFAKPGLTTPKYLVIGHEGYGDVHDAYELGSTAVELDEQFDESVDDPGEYVVTLPAGFIFGNATAPRQPAYWVSTPVSYICNSTTRTIRRYRGYSIDDDPPTSESSTQLSGASQSLLAEDVSNCSFSCDDESGDVDVCQNTLILQASMTRPDASNGERLKVFEQISLVNGL